MLRLPEIVDIIRTRIHSGEYETGKRLPSERVLSDELGVSRRTLRKALQSLEEGKYLSARSHMGRGWYVTDLSVVTERWRAGIEENPRPFDQQLDYRMGIETAAVALAALRRDARDLLDLEDALLAQQELAEALLDTRNAGAESAASVSGRRDGFHDAIARATHNARIIETLDRARADLLIAVHGVVQYDLLQRSFSEHRRIFEAIKARDPGEAVNAMVAHVESVNVLMRKSLGAARDHI